MTASKAGVSQVESCYEELRELIITCELAPGTRLNEKALMERLGYGRTPIREALLRLDHDRLIETKQRSGYLVRPLTRKSVADLLVVWRDVVALILSLSMTNMTEKVREDCISLIEQRREAVRNDPLESSRVTRQLFETLVACADNEPLAHIYHNLIADLERVSVLLFYLPHGANWSGSAEVIAALLREKDPAIAAAKVRERVTESREALLAYLDAHPVADVHLPYLGPRT